jgi:hypothetical protein
MVKNTLASIKACSDLDKTMGFGERSRMMKRWWEGEKLMMRYWRW